MISCEVRTLVSCQVRTLLCGHARNLADVDEEPGRLQVVEVVLHEFLPQFDRVLSQIDALTLTMHFKKEFEEIAEARDDSDVLRWFWQCDGVPHAHELPKEEHWTTA